MLIDSASGAFLEAMRAGGGKPLYELPVDEVRANIRGTSQQLAGPAAAVDRVEDRRIPVPGGDIGLREELIGPPTTLVNAAAEVWAVVSRFHR